MDRSAPTLGSIQKQGNKSLAPKTISPSFLNLFKDEKQGWFTFNHHTLGYIPRLLSKVLIFKVKWSEEGLVNWVRGHLGILSEIANLAKHSHWGSSSVLNDKHANRYIAIYQLLHSIWFHRLSNIYIYIYLKPKCSIS